MKLLHITFLGSRKVYNNDGLYFRWDDCKGRGLLFSDTELLRLYVDMGAWIQEPFSGDAENGGHIRPVVCLDANVTGTVGATVTID